MSRSNPQDTKAGVSVDATQTIDELAKSCDQVFNMPLSSKAIFWPARHPVASPLLNKLPFLFWLMETVRPRKAMQIGLGDGLIYMALCQAAERLGGQTFCLGIDPGDSPLPTDLQSPHDAQYGDISILLKGLPAGGSKLIRDADVLVLNSHLDEELSRIILESWLPQLSKHAIVLVCEPTHVFGSQDLRRVLLDEAGHPVLTGTTSPGGEFLDVILYGDDQPERLRRLASADDVSSLHMAARQVFGRLGQGIEDAQQIAVIKAETADRDHQIKTLQDQFEQCKSDLLTARSQISLLQQSLESERTQTKTGISSELEHNAQWQKNSDVTARMTEIGKSQINAKKTHADSQGELEVLRRQKAELEAEHAARIEDVAVLMQQHEVQLNDLQRSHQQELKAIQHKHAEIQSEVVALREEKAALQGQYNEMVKGFHDSTSWRITKPLRSLKLSLNR